MPNIPFDINSVYGASLVVTSANAGSTVQIKLHDQTSNAAASVTLATWTNVGGSNLLLATPPMTTLPWTHSAWATSTTMKLEILITVAAGGTLKFTKPILEPGAVGDYFDGDTIGGGFLPGSTGIQDFHWLGTNNASVSAYTMNYGLVTGVVDDILPYICPVGLKVGNHPTQQYSVTNYNKYPGT
jgi:hypothetical protein